MLLLAWSLYYVGLIPAAGSSPPAARLLVAWIRGATVPVLMGLAGLAEGCDVAVVLSLWGAFYVAAFYAVTLPVRVLLEVAGAGLAHIHAYLLSRGGVEAAASAATLIVLIVAPVLGYLASQPEAVVSLVNPAYLGYAGSLAVYAAASLTVLASMVASQFVLGLDRSPPDRPGPGVRGAAVAGFTSSALYLALLPVLAATTDPVTGWALASLLGGLVRLLLLLRLLPLEALRTLARVYVRLPAYTVVGYAIGALAPDPALHPRFWGQLVELAYRGLPVLVAAYLIVFALDPWARRLLGRLPSVLEAATARLRYLE
jgi:hypothetical protein